MKTFLEITQQIARQPWSIEDPDFQSISTLFDDSPKLINATQKANSYIYRTYDFAFKRQSMYIDTVQNQKEYTAPLGNITKILCAGNSSPLRYDPELYRLREYTGKPVKYDLQFINGDNKIILHPTPDNVYVLTVKYDTLKTAKRLVSGKYEEVDNLEEDNDILNVPPQFEDMYLQALYAKTMVYLIIDNTDENYEPYERSFNEAMAVLLKNSSGITGDTRIVI